MKDGNKQKFYAWHIYSGENLVATYGFEVYAKEYCEHPDNKNYNLRYERGKERKLHEPKDIEISLIR